MTPRILFSPAYQSLSSACHSVPFPHHFLFYFPLILARSISVFRPGHSLVPHPPYPCPLFFSFYPLPSLSSFVQARLRRNAYCSLFPSPPFDRVGIYRTMVAGARSFLCVRGVGTENCAVNNLIYHQNILVRLRYGCLYS